MNHSHLSNSAFTLADNENGAVQSNTSTPNSNIQPSPFKRRRIIAPLINDGSHVISHLRDNDSLPSLHSTDVAGDATQFVREKLTRGKQKIPIQFIHDRARRYSTFSKRKTGMMKKAVELAELTGADVLVVIASETNHVYTYATERLKGIVDLDCGKELIKTCLSSKFNPNDDNRDNNDSYVPSSTLNEDYSMTVDRLEPSQNDYSITLVPSPINGDNAEKTNDDNNSVHLVDMLQSSPSLISNPIESDPPDPDSKCMEPVPNQSLSQSADSYNSPTCINTTTVSTQTLPVPKLPVSLDSNLAVQLMSIFNSTSSSHGANSSTSVDLKSLDLSSNLRVVALPTSLTATVDNAKGSGSVQSNNHPVTIIVDPDRDVECSSSVISATSDIIPDY